MTKRQDERSPKIWPDKPGIHFNPYQQEADDNRRLHERGTENKIRWTMGERNKKRLKAEAVAYAERRGVTIRANNTTVTLPVLKWMQP